MDFKSIRSVSSRAVLEQLDNLPVLNELTLQEAFLGINDLENIHHNIPSIRAFELHTVTIVGSTMPIIISSITGMTSLNISIYRIVNTKTHIQFYQYMTKKYCNVDVIKCYDNMLSQYYDDNRRRRVYLDGIMDFYKVIAPKQISFNIHDVPDGVNVLDIFDEMDCKLEELTVTKCQEEILQHLSHSNQSRYIKKLLLIRTNVSSIHCIKRMEALTVLRLDLYDRSRPIVDLSACLNACPPTLKEFTLLCDLMEFAISNVHLNSIETLEISCKSVDRRLADTISSSFPKLVNLTLLGQITENIYITLSNPSFQKVKFSIPWLKSYGVTFKAPNQVVPQHYIIARGGCSLVPYAQLSRLPVLTVTCITEKRLKFSDWVEILPV